MENPHLRKGDIVWFHDGFLTSADEGVVIILEEESRHAYWILFNGKMHYALDTELYRVRNEK